MILILALDRHLLQVETSQISLKCHEFALRHFLELYCAVLHLDDMCQIYLLINCFGWVMDES